MLTLFLQSGLPLPHKSQGRPHPIRDQRSFAFLTKKLPFPLFSQPGAPRRFLRLRSFTCKVGAWRLPQVWRSSAILNGAPHDCYF